VNRKKPTGKSIVKIQKPLIPASSGAARADIETLSFQEVDIHLGIFEVGNSEFQQSRIALDSSWPGLSPSKRKSSEVKQRIGSSN